MFSGRINDTKISSDTLITAIDLGKVKNVAYCRKVNGQDLKIGSFEHNRMDYQRVFDQIMRFSKEQKCSNVVICMESTSVYGIPLQHFLMYKQVTLVSVNPFHTKRAKEITDNSPNKSDEKDPRVMADIVQLGRFLSVVIPEGVSADLRQLIHARERAMLRLDRLYNQLHELTFELFPEFLNVLKDLRTQTALNLLKHYSNPIDIVSLGIEDLHKKIFSYSRGKKRDSKKTAELLYSAAQKSVGVHHGSDMIAFEIKGIISQIECVKEFMSELEVKISEQLRSVKWSEWLLSIPRLGKITTAAIIGEFADLQNFKSISETMKFAGLNLYETSSGKFKSNCRISKRGRSVLRKFLYYAALNMIRKGGIFHDTYKDYHKQNRMKHTEAIIAISRKLLRIIYALVHNECAYDPKHKRMVKIPNAA